jgi:hypothetical protein
MPGMGGMPGMGMGMGMPFVCSKDDVKRIGR